MVRSALHAGGREIPMSRPHDQSGNSRRPPCVFCGRPIRHVNDGGTGWLLGAVVAGESRTYLYCHDGPCSRSSATWIWRCGCTRATTSRTSATAAVAAGGPGAMPSRTIGSNAPACGAGPLARRPAWHRQRAVPVVHRRAGPTGRCCTRPRPGRCWRSCRAASTGSEIVAHARSREGRPTNREGHPFSLEVVDLMHLTASSGRSSSAVARRPRRSSPR